MKSMHTDERYYCTILPVLFRLLTVNEQGSYLEDQDRTGGNIEYPVPVHRFTDLIVK
jgi:hypothetical protein